VDVGVMIFIKLIYDFDDLSGFLAGSSIVKID
jgi:hypothetical protein